MRILKLLTIAALVSACAGSLQPSSYPVVTKVYERIDDETCTLPVHGWFVNRAGMEQIGRDKVSTEEHLGVCRARLEDADSRLRPAWCGSLCVPLTIIIGFAIFGGGAAVGFEAEKAIGAHK